MVPSVPYRQSLRWDQDDFARAVSGTTGYEAMLEERAYDIVGIGTPNGSIRWISPSVTDFLGWHPSEVIGLEVTQLLHPDDMGSVVAGRLQVTRVGRTRRELRIRRRDGGFRWFSTHAAPLIDSEGAPVGLIGGWRCIDEEVAEREQTYATSRRLRVLIDAMSDPYASMTATRDVDGNVVDFHFVDGNAAAAEALGLDLERLPGASLRDTVPGPPFDWLMPRLVEAMDSQASMTTHGRPGEPLGQPANTYWDLIVDPVGDDTVAARWMETTSRVSQERNEASRLVEESIDDERDRIAADLHDGFVQQVLYTGMTLSTIMPDLPADLQPLATRLVQVQDDMIRQLRATILALSQTDLDRVAPSEAVARIAREATMHVGLQVRADIIGPLDDIDDQRLLRHMLFAVREMILNVVRHARATQMTLSVAATAHHLSLTVSDDGVGPGDMDTPGHGLANLAGRAAQLGGTFVLRSGDVAGAVAEWRVPLFGTDSTDWGEG